MSKIEKKTTQETAEELLRQPYARIILPETDGTFRGEIIEFPGCIVTGETAADTFSALENAAKGWLLAALESGQTIPRPVESVNDFSGRFVLRIPKSLHKKAAWFAEREGVSLNQFISTSLSETVGERVARQDSQKIFSTSNYISISYVHVSQQSQTRSIGSPYLTNNQDQPRWSTLTSPEHGYLYVGGRDA